MKVNKWYDYMKKKICLEFWVWHDCCQGLSNYTYLLTDLLRKKGWKSTEPVVNYQTKKTRHTWIQECVCILKSARWICTVLNVMLNVPWWSRAHLASCYHWHKQTSYTAWTTLYIGIIHLVSQPPFDQGWKIWYVVHLGVMCVNALQKPRPE